MRIKLSKLYVLSIYIAMLGQACMFIGLPFQMILLTTLGTYSILGAAFLCLGVWFVNKEKENDDAGEKLLFIAFLIFAAVSLIYSWTFSYTALVKIITFLELPIFLLTADKVKNKNTKNFIYALNMIYPVIFVILFFSPFSHRYFSATGMVTHESLTLGYNNPNETAIYLLFNFMILLAATFRLKPLFLRLFCLFEAILVGYFILLTDSRVAIIIMGVVVVGSFVFKRIRLSRWLLWPVFSVPIFFFFILRWFPDIIILGEEFDTGRSLLYLEAFSQMDFGKFMWGDFAYFSLFNMHNAMLSVLASLGIISSVIFFVVLYRQVKKLGKTVALQERKVLLIGVLAIVVHSAIEACVLIGGTAYSSLFFALYYLCLDDSDITGETLNESTTY